MNTNILKEVEKLIKHYRNRIIVDFIQRYPELNIDWIIYDPLDQDISIWFKDSDDSDKIWHIREFEVDSPTSNKLRWLLGELDFEEDNAEI